MLIKKLACMLALFSAVATIGCKVVRAQAPPTAGYVQYQGFAPSGACTLPQLIIVNTVGSQAGIYQCKGVPLTWQLSTGSVSGVASINSAIGAFSFNGPGVSCTLTTCTFSGSGTGIGSIAWTLPSWLTANPTTLSASGSQTFAPTTGQTSHQVIGTCGTATTFGPCSLVAADIPALPYLSSATQLPVTIAAVSHSFLASYNSGSGMYTTVQPVFADIAGTLGGGQMAALVGDVTAPGGSATTTLATVNSGPGACGDATHVCAITTNAKGLTISQSAVAISGGGSVSSVFGRTGTVTAATNDYSFSQISGTATAAQLPVATSSVVGAVKPDGITITISAGVLSAVTGGTGTVTAFTAGTLSPLFTTSVANGTSTPALTFTLASAAQNSVFAGPATGGTGAPSYRALVSLDIPANAANTTGTAAGLSGSQTANFIYAAPNGSAGTAAFRALVAADVPVLNQNTTGTAANVTSTVAVSHGGTGTTSTLVGLMRGNSSAMTAAELSGDATTSGSNAVTVTGVNGAVVPASAPLVGTNGSRQLVASTGHSVNVVSVCADTSASGTAQVCNTSPTFTPVANDCVVYTTTTANTGTALTLNVNSLGAKSVAKWLGATTLAAGDVPVGQAMLSCYNGTVWNLATIGNAPSGGGGSGTVTHTAGALTALAIVLGNGSADIKVDTGSSSDGAGNYTMVSLTTTGVGGTAGGYDNTQGTTQSVSATGHCRIQALTGSHYQISCNAGAYSNVMTTTDVAPAFATLTDAATVTWAIGSAPLANASLTFTVHSGARALNLTGLVTGGSYVLKVIQDGTGGEGLTLGTGCAWKVSGGGTGAITPSTGANALDVLAFIYDGANCLTNFNKNFN